MAIVTVCGYNLVRVSLISCINLLDLETGAALAVTGDRSCDSEH